MTRLGCLVPLVFVVLLGLLFRVAVGKAKAEQALHESQKREREATKFGLAAMGYHQAAEKKYANLLATTRKGQLPRPIGGLK